MKQKFDEDFPVDGEDFDSIPEDLETNDYENTVELSNKGFSQELVQEMNNNQLKIAKLKLANLIKKKKQIKAYLKENQLTKGTKEAN